MVKCGNISDSNAKIISVKYVSVLALITGRMYGAPRTQLGTAGPGP